MQHAINETAEEIASTAYIYEVSGIREIHDIAQDGIENNTAGLKENVSNILDILKSLGGDNALPLDQIEAATDLIAGGAFNGMKTELLTPLARKVMEKYITEGIEGSADDRLRLLNVKDGLQGMDFSQSSFLEDEEENIEIVISYEINLPVPIKIFPEFKIVQRALAKAWLSGDEPSEADNNSSEADSVWSLGNLERGTKIRNIFGANLPFYFPTIAKFVSGKAIMIKSMDFTATSYQDTKNICKNLEEYVIKLEKYTGQESPWGSEGIVIKNQDIDSKQLLLVIPGNEMLPAVKEVFDWYVIVARSKGIELKIQRYGIKKIQENDVGKDENTSVEKNISEEGK